MAVILIISGVLIVVSTSVCLISIKNAVICHERYDFAMKMHGIKYEERSGEPTVWDLPDLCEETADGITYGYDTENSYIEYRNGDLTIPIT